MRKIITLIITILMINTSYAAIQWETVDGFTLKRTAVPQGWLVRQVGVYGSSISFVYDPEHKWKI